MRRSTSSLAVLAVVALLPVLSSCSGGSSDVAAQPSSAVASSSSPAPQVPALPAGEVPAIPGYDAAPAAQPALPAVVVAAAGAGLEGTAAQDLRTAGTSAGTFRVLRFAQSVTEDDLAARMPAIVGAAGGATASPVDVRGDSALQAGATVGLRVGWDVYLLTSTSGPDGATTLAADLVSAID